MDNDRSNIELVKERTDIVSVIERYVHLKQSGHNFTGLCPFHTEKTPSFSVNPTLQIYKCFGCGKSGDVLEFVQEIEKLDFPQTLEKLAKEAGVQLKSQSQPASPVMQINDWAKTYYQKELVNPANEEALNYVKSRGIAEKQLKDFGIGYAPGGSDFLNRLLKYKNFPKSVLIDSGLFVEKEGAIKEKFNKRVMFPIFNNSGKAIAFSGRLLPGNEYGPKYLNSPETSIYQKRNTLYGYNLAKGSIRKEDLCIILEGNTDVISMHKVGFTNSVAPLGTGLTKEQLILISNQTKNILFLFDTDTAGQAAVERGFRLALTLNLTCYSANTGKYKDVDELIQADPEELKKIIENRTDTFSYLLSRKAEEIGVESLKSVAFLSRFAKSFIQAVSDETEKHFFISKAKSIIPGLEIEENKTQTVESRLNVIKNELLDIEDMYIKSALEKGNLEDLKLLDSAFFQKESTKSLLELIKANDINNIKELYNHVDNTKLKSKIESVLLSNAKSEDLEVLKKRVTIRNIESEVKKLRILLAIAEEKEDTSQINELLSKILEVTNNLKKYKDEDIKLR